MFSIFQKGETCLIVASWSDSRDQVVMVLLEAKADPNITAEVKLYYSHSLYSSIFMYHVTEWSDCSP